MVHLVTAVIKPHRLEAVKAALGDAGVIGMTATEVRGAGRQGGKTENYRGSEYTIDLLPKIRIEILADEDDVDAIVEALSSAARTDKIGDGKIWSAPIGEIIRIRTGEAGVDAL